MRLSAIFTPMTLPCYPQPVPCEGHIESWLPIFLTMVKSSLQYQLAVALGIEKPARTRAIHSAGARRVSVQDRRSPMGSANKGKSSYHSRIISSSHGMEVGVTGHPWAVPTRVSHLIIVISYPALMAWRLV